MITWILVCMVHSFNVSNADIVYEMEKDGSDISVIPVSPKQ